MINGQSQYALLTLREVKRIKCQQLAKKNVTEDRVAWA